MCESYFELKRGTLLDDKIYLSLSGAIAQLGERIVRNDEVVGSIPTSSTKYHCRHPARIIKPHVQSAQESCLFPRSAAHLIGFTFQDSTWGSVRSKDRAMTRDAEPTAAC